jgi:hypothetical protein
VKGDAAPLRAELFVTILGIDYFLADMTATAASDLSFCIAADGPLVEGLLLRIDCDHSLT